MINILTLVDLYVYTFSTFLSKVTYYIYIHHKHLGVQYPA